MSKHSDDRNNSFSFREAAKKTGDFFEECYHVAWNALTGIENTALRALPIPGHFNYEPFIEPGFISRPLTHSYTWERVRHNGTNGRVQIITPRGRDLFQTLDSFINLVEENDKGPFCAALEYSPTHLSDSSIEKALIVTLKSTEEFRRFCINNWDSIIDGSISCAFFGDKSEISLSTYDALYHYTFYEGGFELGVEKLKDLGIKQQNPPILIEPSVPCLEQGWRRASRLEDSDLIYLFKEFSLLDNPDGDGGFGPKNIKPMPDPSFGKVLKYNNYIPYFLAS